MKKILFIINCFSKGGGAESLLTRIVNNLNPDKYEIGIMEIIHDTIKEEPIRSGIRRYPYYVKADDPERKAKMYYVYHEWDKVIAEYIPQDYDLYVSFNYQKPSFLLPPGKKCIAWIHGDVYDLARQDKQEEKELQAKAFEKADRIVAISDITTQSLIDLFPQFQDKMKIIYNGIDVENVRKRAQEPTNLVIKHPAIFSVGRLDQNKNPLRLLDIFERVHRVKKDVHLYYLGYGALDETIREKTTEKNLDGFVHLLGYLENPFPVIAQGDVCGMFSKSEGFPMSLLECVALDKPFVSSIIGGARILANHQTCGKTVETDDMAAKEILTMLDKSKEESRQECRASIQRFELNEYIHQIEELFDEVLSK